MIGLGLGLVRQAVRNASGQAWTPAQLFSSGEQGVWYEPKPEYLYQDAAGTTPVTADGDPVGLMLDLSGNGDHATQSTSAARPIYRTNGTLHWLEFDGVDDILIAQGTESVLTFMHNGTGGGAAAAVEFLSGNAFQRIFGTNTGSTASTGFGLTRLDRDSGSEDNGYRVSIYRGVQGSPAVNINQENSDITELTPRVMRMSYLNNAAPDDLIFADNGVLKAKAQTVNTPATGNSSRALMIMGLSGVIITHGKFSGGIVREGGLRGSDGDSADAYLATLNGAAL